MQGACREWGMCMCVTSGGHAQGACREWGACAVGVSRVGGVVQGACHEWGAGAAGVSRRGGRLFFVLFMGIKYEI